MLKKLISGFVWGIGFVIALSLSAFVYNNFIYTSPIPIQDECSQLTDSNSTPFDHQSLAQKRESSIAIFLTEYVTQNDGQRKSIIKEVFKTEPEGRFHFIAGNEYQRGSYYPVGKDGKGDGAIVFFACSPERQIISHSYRDGRVLGFGDMPLETFKNQLRK